MESQRNVQRAFTLLFLIAAITPAASAATRRLSHRFTSLQGGNITVTNNDCSKLVKFGPVPIYLGINASKSGAIVETEVNVDDFGGDSAAVILEGSKFRGRAVTTRPGVTRIVATSAGSDPAFVSDDRTLSCRVTKELHLSDNANPRDGIGKLTITLNFSCRHKAEAPQVCHVRYAGNMSRKEGCGGLSCGDLTSEHGF